MAIFRIFRTVARKADQAEGLEVKRILKHGPLDRPTGLREPDSYMRSLDGRW